MVWWRYLSFLQAFTQALWTVYHVSCRMHAKCTIPRQTKIQKFSGEGTAPSRPLPIGEGNTHSPNPTPSAPVALAPRYSRLRCSTWRTWPPNECPGSAIVAVNTRTRVFFNIKLLRVFSVQSWIGLQSEHLWTGSIRWGGDAQQPISELVSSCPRACRCCRCIFMTSLNDAQHAATGMGRFRQDWADLTFDPAIDWLTSRHTSRQCTVHNDTMLHCRSRSYAILCALYSYSPGGATVLTDVNICTAYSCSSAVASR